ncbi:MAG: hypothetical protein ACRCYU_14635, partial [Nocardioides sp.]
PAPLSADTSQISADASPNPADASPNPADASPNPADTSPNPTNTSPKAGDLVSGVLTERPPAAASAPADRPVGAHSPGAPEPVAPGSLFDIPGNQPSPPQPQPDLTATSLFDISPPTDRPASDSAAAIPKNASTVAADPAARPKASGPHAIRTDIDLISLDSLFDI